MALLLLKSPESYPELQLISLEHSYYCKFMSEMCIAFIFNYNDT